VRNDGVHQRAGGVKAAVAPGIPGPPRVGFVVGRDVGSAVRRNRVKRRLREAVALVPLSDGHDYVVVGTGVVADLPFQEVVELVRTATRG
jgi:ribonuclease P protein component